MKLMKYGWLAILCLVLPAGAFADGGVIVARERQGNFDLTLTVHPGVLRAGPADLGVLVQNVGKKRPVLDAKVRMLAESVATTQEGSWVPPCCRMKTDPGLIDARRTGFGNRLFYRARMMFTSPGEWVIFIAIKTGEEEMEWRVPLEVRPATPPLLAYWGLLAFPATAIGGFVLRRRLVKRRNRLTGKKSMA